MSTVTTYLNLVKPAPLEAFSRATYNTNLDLIDTAYDKLAKGQVGHAEVPNPSGAIGAKTVIINIASVSFKAGRKYKIELHGNYSASGTTSTAAFTIGTCSTADAANNSTGITNIKSIADRPNVTGEGRSLAVIRTGITFGVDTTLQIKATIERVNGGDGFFTSCSADNPITLTVYDMGAQ